LGFKIFFKLHSKEKYIFCKTEFNVLDTKYTSVYTLVSLITVLFTYVTHADFYLSLFEIPHFAALHSE